MEKDPSPFDLIFENLSKTLIEKSFNSKSVADRVSSLKSFTRKADRAYLSYSKKCTEEFLSEEEKIYTEISANIEEVEGLSEDIRKEIADIEETIEDSRKLIERSRDLSKGIETINRRIKSHQQIVELHSKLIETCTKARTMIVDEIRKDAIIMDEID